MCWCRVLFVALAGQMLRKNLRKSLLDPEKLHSELRMKGHASLSNVFAVILEPTGSFTVITKGQHARHARA